MRSSKWMITLVLFGFLIYPSQPAVPHKMMAEYKLLYPYEWKTGEFEDLDTMFDCYCPRVYWPVCSNESVTYPNHCVLICAQKTLRRLGPCIKYRRNMGENLSIVLPKIWKNPPKALEKVTPGEFVVENITSW